MKNSFCLVHEKLENLTTSDLRGEPSSLISNPEKHDGFDVPDTPSGGQKSILGKDKAKGQSIIIKVIRWW